MAIKQVRWPNGMFPQTGDLTNDEKKRMRQYWRTPDSLIRQLEKDHNIKFILDLCATTEETGVCDNVITEEQDIFLADIGARWREALSKYEGSARPVVWMNPPYNDTATFLQRATNMAKEHGFDLFCLLKADSSTRWFSTFIWDMAHTAYFPTKRISHDAPDYRLTKKETGNNFASVIAYWNHELLNDLPEDHQATCKKYEV